jgi:chromosome segregation ATPase
MTSGRQALGTIQSAIAQEQKRTRELEQRLAETSQRLAELDVGRGEALEALARLRLEHLEHAGSAERVAAADARVLSMLERRRAQIEALQASLERVDREIEEQRAERERRADHLEEVDAELDEAEASTQARLDADPVYREVREQTQAAVRIAQHAADSAARSEREREHKQRAYHGDPLFMYLWRRRYGTREARSGRLTRWLDRRVAHHIGYEAAAVNYARLQELPLRLREHADAVEAQAEEALAALARLDEAAREADGVTAIERTRDEAAEALSGVDERLEGLGRELATGLEELERVARGEDEAYREALAFLASELGRDDVEALRQQALATPFPEDDVLVAQLLDLERDRQTAEASLHELQETTARSRERLRELEQLRIDYTRQRMDQPGTTFADGALVMTMLGQFLQGAMTRQALWRILEQQRRVAPQRSDPTFGSGGFGRGSPWTSGGQLPRGPGIPRTGGGFRTGGSFGGGGFRTGGRIGGGGFRTGGKF